MTYSHPMFRLFIVLLIICVLAVGIAHGDSSGGNPTPQERAAIEAEQKILAEHAQLRQQAEADAAAEMAAAAWKRESDQQKAAALATKAKQDAEKAVLTEKKKRDAQKAVAQAAAAANKAAEEQRKAAATDKKDAQSKAEKVAALEQKRQQQANAEDARKQEEAKKAAAAEKAGKAAAEEKAAAAAAEALQKKVEEERKEEARRKFLREQQETEAKMKQEVLQKQMLELAEKKLLADMKERERKLKVCSDLKRNCKSNGNIDEDCEVCICEGGWEGQFCNICNKLCNLDAGFEVDPACSKCQCRKGFSLKGEICEDVNECADQTARCAVHARCYNTQGAFKCGKCPSGYFGSGYKRCFEYSFYISVLVFGVVCFVVLFAMMQRRGTASLPLIKKKEKAE